MFANTAHKNGKHYDFNDAVVLHTKTNNKRNITFPSLKKEIDHTDKSNMIFIHDMFK